MQQLPFSFYLFAYVPQIALQRQHGIGEITLTAPRQVNTGFTDLVSQRYGTDITVSISDARQSERNAQPFAHIVAQQLNIAFQDKVRLEAGFFTQLVNDPQLTLILRRRAIGCLAPTSSV